ncbi:MAG TPA: hypothetical protein DCZ94_01205 [Lentisphaeria bacterium]|nr:MAG: hypothetical protein A2X48_11570 [Lentisphaerae bacterium GWF2_49_21]HBC85549.1 hypothetical protein [Lentisphaeria bacterium]
MSLKDSDIAEIIRKVNGIDLELPDPLPDEPPLTHEQFEEIQKLSDNILPDEKVLELGKWQAAHVIFKLKEVELKIKLAEDDQEEEDRLYTIKLIILFSGFLFLALYGFIFFIRNR